MEFDDGRWAPIAVPGTLNAPPDEAEVDGWYRTRFRIPADWQGSAITLKFGSVNYIADVWLNGEWLGYHEAGPTPFAFDATPLAAAGSANLLAVRVDNPTWGTRTDIVPWGLGDWWNYGGITGPVWLEAAPSLHVARADIVPHLDAADVSVLVERAALAGGAQAGASAGAEDALPAEATVTLDIFAVDVTDATLTTEDPRRLVADDNAALSSTEVEIETPIQVVTRP